MSIFWNNYYNHLPVDVKLIIMRNINYWKWVPKIGDYVSSGNLLVQILKINFNEEEYIDEYEVKLLSELSLNLSKNGYNSIPERQFYFNKMTNSIFKTNNISKLSNNQIISLNKLMPVIFNMKTIQILSSINHSVFELNIFDQVKKMKPLRKIEDVDKNVTETKPNPNMNYYGLHTEDIKNDINDVLVMLNTAYKTNDNDLNNLISEKIKFNLNKVIYGQKKDKEILFQEIRSWCSWMDNQELPADTIIYTPNTLPDTKISYDNWYDEWIASMFDAYIKVPKKDNLLITIIKKALKNTNDKKLLHLKKKLLYEDDDLELYCHHAVAEICNEILNQSKKLRILPNDLLILKYWLNYRNKQHDLSKNSNKSQLLYTTLSKRVLDRWYQPNLFL
tara:strand:+ start:327 stop:1499 length:1173 start_codon:yes stop_codon:yes gene_type:complete